MDKFNKLALAAVDLQRNGKFKEAKKIYIELLTIQGKNPQILRLLGAAEYELKNYLKSFEYLNKSIEINPNESETYSNRGMVNAKLNNTEQAIEDYLRRQSSRSAGRSGNAVCDQGLSGIRRRQRGQSSQRPCHGQFTGHHGRGSKGP